MKKTLRILGIVFILLIVGLFGFYLVKNENLPEGNSGPEADEMARAMLTAMNHTAWQNTEQVSWTFRGAHDYSWDRKEHKVSVTWGDNTVTLNPETMEGIASTEGKALTAEEEQALIKTAWDYFNNDSFWLAAPFKVFDPGTERSIVTVADGRKGLKITYTSGGTTPGDSYVWILGDDNRPVACKMWVSIIPIGGIEFTWENYQQLPSGVPVATEHIALGLLNVDLSNLK
ncbi:MAG: hypothetical protein Roseis2KO_19290 [Roseivirga sp.]